MPSACYTSKGSRRITDAPRRRASSLIMHNSRHSFVHRVTRRRANGAYGLQDDQHEIARPREEDCGTDGAGPAAPRWVRGSGAATPAVPNWRPRSLFGTFSRERKYAPRLVLPEKKNPPLIHIKSLHTLLTMWINRQLSPQSSPYKEGIISPFMEYNHEGAKYSTRQVDNKPPSPQSFNQPKRGPFKPQATFPQFSHPLLLLLLYNI